jgi:thiamine pyrophosphate-dependent acetolactate synthase large subunit-like protein
VRKRQFGMTSTSRPSRSSSGCTSGGSSPMPTPASSADFAKMAEAAGVLGLKADVPEQVRPMLAQALSTQDLLS